MNNLTQEQKEDNSYAYWRGEQEGWGYAVRHYCRGSNWKDPKTTQLWDKAEAALKELEDYLETFKEEEFC